MESTRLTRFTIYMVSNIKSTRLNKFSVFLFQGGGNQSDSDCDSGHSG